MMEYFLWTIVLFFVLILQGSLSLFNITPNLTVVLACYAGIREGEVKGMLFGSLIGMIEDSVSGTLLGTHFLSKGLIGYLSSFLYSKLFLWTPLLGVVSIAALTLIDSLIIFCLRSIFDKMPLGIGTASLIILIQSVLNAPLGLFLKPKKVT